MSAKSQLLRERIRQGSIACRCKLQGGHYEGCEWAKAVADIYEQERAEQACEEMTRLNQEMGLYEDPK
jgi:hypothetical protein